MPVGREGHRARERGSEGESERVRMRDCGTKGQRGIEADRERVLDTWREGWGAFQESVCLHQRFGCCRTFFYGAAFHRRRKPFTRSLLLHSITATATATSAAWGRRSEFHFAEQCVVDGCFDLGGVGLVAWGNRLEPLVELDPERGAARLASSRSWRNRVAARMPLIAMRNGAMHTIKIATRARKHKFVEPERVA